MQSEDLLSWNRSACCSAWIRAHTHVVGAEQVCSEGSPYFLLPFLLPEMWGCKLQMPI